MASSFTGLGTELMTTGENAGTWGTTTNTNLQIVEQISGGYIEQDIAGSADTTTLSVSDGSAGAVLAHRIIKFTGTITGNQIVTIPLDVQQLYVLVNGTSGAYTVQFKYASGSGSSVTFAATDKGTKLVYATADHATNPNLVDTGIASTGDHDLDGNELILDADADTSITADTDDQIDIRIAGADDFQFTANTFTAQAGSTIAAQALTATTVTASGIVKTDDTTEATSTTDGSLQTDGGLSVAKDAVLGDDVKLLSDSAVLSFGADSDTTLTHTDGTGLTLNGANKLTFRDTGLTIGSNADGDLDIVSDGTAVDSINLESAGGITLDAGTAASGIIYEDDGTEMARIHNSSSNVILETKVSDADFSIKGNDGGSTITPLTFDMSDAGKATFSGNVIVSGDLTVSGDDITMGTNTAGNLLVADGTNFNSIAAGSLSEISTVASDDVFIAVDTSGGGLKKITRSTLVAGLATSGAIANVVEDTSPQLGGDLDTNSANILIDDAHFIADENGNEQIIFQTTGSAVNQFDITNAATGNPPSIKATGGDSNIDFNISAKGTGHVTVLGDTNSGAIQFNCEQNSHGQIVIAQPHSASVTNTLTLPAGASSTLVSLVSTDTLTNKTLTTPVIAEIDSGSTITLDATTDIVLDADGGDVFFKDAGTTIATFTNSSTDFIIETATSDKDLIFKVNDGGSSTEVARFDGDVSAFKVASGKKIMLGAAEESISGDGTDITFAVGSSGDINIPADIGLTFGDDGEKIEGDGTDLTIAGNNINLTAVADVNIPSGVGLTFATAEKIESDGTDLSITVGSNGDINVPANIGLTFGDDGEKIEGDGTDLTIAGNNINLTAVADVVIPNNVGIQFGGASEKIEGDGTDLTISANNLTVDAAADINLDADGADVNIKDGGTTILSFTNSSSDAVITAGVQDKDIIFKGDDGGSAVTSLTLDMSAGGIATFSAAANVAQGALTSSSNAVAWDASAKPNAVHVTTENTTFSAPSNAVEGAFICIEINYNGSHSIGWNTVFEFAASTEATETATDGKTDIHVFRYNGAVWQEVGRTLNLAES
jgi:hypothetical protein